MNEDSLNRTASPLAERASCSLHVLIVGAGIGGLCLAQGLARTGVDVAVYERGTSVRFPGHSYRIRLMQGGVRALRDCLPQPLFDLCVATSLRPASQMVLWDDQLTPASTRSLPRREPGLAGFPVNQLTLREILLAGLDGIVRFGKAFERFEPSGSERVRAYFADGTTETGDLLVGADGTGSAVRGQLLPDALLDELSWAIYGRTPITDGLLEVIPGVLADTLSQVTIPGDGTVSITPCRPREPVAQAGARIAPAVELTDVPGYFSWTMPLSDPGLRAADATALHRAATESVAGLHPAVRRIIATADVPATFAVRVSSAQPVDPWRSPVVTLLGDAIHTMSSGQGRGANIALKDAGLLSRALLDVAAGRAELAEAKAGYETEMLRYGFEAVAEVLNQPPAQGTPPRREAFNVAYAGTPPWDIGRPQDVFARLAEDGALRGRILDIGCGTGEHALLCATLGLDATGIDIAPTAISKARCKAAERGLTVRFLAGDVLDLSKLDEHFDTVIDSGLFHCLADEDRLRFARSLRSALSPGGRYYLLCLSDRQPGTGHARRISQQEIRDSFADGWTVDSIEPARLILTGPGSAHAWLATITCAH